ncbi:hypothetical protein BC831DRAFT_461062 [Entophlyctis helioformis]|nr:hypothetical protein BC831DRAFT_461062 [Entophlyctis helioformis]
MSSCALSGITSMTVPATHDRILNAWLLAVLAAPSMAVGQGTASAWMLALYPLALCLCRQ